jgi:hypothetical protein
VRRCRPVRAAVDPTLDDAELTLRRAKSTERGALLAREQIQRELGVINGRLLDVQAQLEEETWLSVPSAAAHLFEAAEGAQVRLAECLSALDSVASHAYA